MEDSEKANGLENQENVSKTFNVSETQKAIVRRETKNKNRYIEVSIRNEKRGFHLGK